MRGILAAIATALAVLAMHPALEAPAQEAAGASRPLAFSGEVLADKLNVRVKPGLGRTVVAILSQGEKVEASSVKGDWAEIEAPARSAVWVAVANAQDGRLKRGAPLRAGPGVAYDSFGAADSEEAVKIVDASQEGWLRIEPPRGLSAYVSARHLKFSPEALTKLKASDEAKDALEPARQAEADDGGAAKEAATARTVMIEGVLLPVKDAKRLATHALAAEVNGEYHTLCYLKGANFNLQLWERRKVRVKGLQTWVGDWRRPLVEIEHITPVWQ